MKHVPMDFPMFAALTLVALVACHHAPAPAAEMTPSSRAVTTVRDVGFDGPENLVYDPVADVYLVSNMGGSASARDDNGYISRVSPDGRVLALRWIAGGVGGAVLDAPKGIAIRGDTIAVADVGAVHFFNRVTGAPLRTVALPGAVMNDVAWDGEGALWITDTGPDRSHPPIDTSADLDAVWRVSRDGRVQSVARGLWLDRPDGLVTVGAEALVSTFGAHRVERVAMGSSAPRVEVTVPGGRVDGLRRLGDGTLLLSSWDARTVWHRSADGVLRPLLTGVTSPAGIAVDTRRSRLAVTSMQDNALYLLPLP